MSSINMKMEPAYLILEREAFYVVASLLGVKPEDSVESIRVNKKLFDGVVVLHQ